MLQRHDVHGTIEQIASERQTRQVSYCVQRVIRPRCIPYCEIDCDVSQTLKKRRVLRFPGAGVEHAGVTRQTVGE
jgi:hypothetical protein